MELGVQSLHDESLVRMNRGHNSACSLEAIKRLHAYGLKVYAHLIIGVPNETPAMWKQSVQGLVDAGIDGIKFHNLHIIHNTDLAREYAKNPFALLNEYEYAEALMELLRTIPSHIPILRLATDTPDKELVAPKWHMAKGQFGEYVVQSMHYRGIVQGDLTISPFKSHATSKGSPVLLDDGSITIWNERYHDYYHPKSGAYRQAKELFIEKSDLRNRLKKGDVRILDIGFGMGYNTFCALEVAQSLAQNRVYVKAIDQDRMLLQHSQLMVPNASHVALLDALFNTKTYDDVFCKVEFLNMEARYGITLLEESFDVIFLDPFIESNNASLVTFDFFTMLRKHLKADGVLVASTSLQVVYDGLMLAGFEVCVTNDVKSDIKGIVATLSSSISTPSKEPYRDPYGVWSDKEIESRHQKKLSF